MNAKAVVVATLAAGVSAPSCLAILYYHPVGDLRLTQWLILGGSTATGLGVFLVFQGRKGGSTWFATLAPVALAMMAISMIASATAAVTPLERSFVADVSSGLSRECEDVLIEWPAAAVAADYRRLEWELRASEHSVLGIDRTRRALGLEQKGHLGRIDARLRETVFASQRSPRPVTPGPVPPGRDKQYRRMGLRVHEAAVALCEAADNTHLESIREWSTAIEQSVRPLTENPVE